MYGFKMDLFDNGKPEKFLLLIRNYNVALEASGTLTTNGKFQYICTLLRGNALQKFETLCTQILRTTMASMNQVISGLATHFTLVTACSKQKRAMHHEMRKPSNIKLRRYHACMVDFINIFLYSHEKRQVKNW